MSPGGFNVISGGKPKNQHSVYRCIEYSGQKIAPLLRNACWSNCRQPSQGVIQDFAKKFSGFMAIGVQFAVSISDWTTLRWLSMPPIFVGIRQMVPSIVSNGLALCALHHKLFDRGAFSLSETLTIEVSARVNGTGGLVEFLTRFNRNSIAMPNLRNAKPDLRFVRWHNEEVFHKPVGDWVTEDAIRVTP
jgi:HNH endonuclease